MEFKITEAAGLEFAPLEAASGFALGASSHCMSNSQSMLTKVRQRPGMISNTKLRQ